MGSGSCNREYKAPTREQYIKWLNGYIADAEADLIKWRRQLAELEQVTEVDRGQLTVIDNG